MRVRFRLHVHSGFSTFSSEDILLERAVDLPIVPFVGLDVAEGDWSARIASLSIRDGEVEAWVEDDRTLYNYDMYGGPVVPTSPIRPRLEADYSDPGRPRILDVVEEYLAEGWAWPSRREWEDRVAFALLRGGS